ncbi:MAG: hypothetical protein AB2693_17405, partial [Candidatus Thiodiazotropha sp.]
MHLADPAASSARSRADDTKSDGYLSAVKRKDEEKLLTDIYHTDKKKQGDRLRQIQGRDQDVLELNPSLQLKGDQISRYMPSTQWGMDQEILRVNRRMKDILKHDRPIEQGRFREELLPMEEEELSHKQREAEERRKRLEYFRDMNRYEAAEPSRITAGQFTSGLENPEERLHRLSLNMMGLTQNLQEEAGRVASETDEARKRVKSNGNPKEEKLQSDTDKRLRLREVTLPSAEYKEKMQAPQNLEKVTPLQPAKSAKSEPLKTIEKEIADLDRRLTVLGTEGYLEDSDLKLAYERPAAKNNTTSQTETQKKKYEQDEKRQTLKETELRKGQESYIPLSQLRTGAGDIDRRVPIYNDPQETWMPSRTNVRRQLEFGNSGQYQDIYPRDFLASQGYRQPNERDYQPYSPIPLPLYHDELRNRVHWSDKKDICTNYGDVYPPWMQNLDADTLPPFAERRRENEMAIKMESENPYQESLLLEQRIKEDMIRKQEEELRKKEIELNKREKWIKEQEELRERRKMLDPFDEVLAQRVKELKEKMEKLKTRENELRKREEVLMIETADDKKQQQNNPSLCKNQSTMTDEEEIKSVVIKDTNTDRKITCENPFLIQKISQFSGEDPKPKNEASYEEWRYEVNCLRKEHKETDIAQAIRKSLRGQAKKVLLPLGASASIADIMTKMEGVFGNVATGESVLREFYTATQNQDETVASWGLRLEELLQKAIDKGHLKPDEKNDMLREKFWRALRSDRLKNATRVHYE